jgi:ATP-dependent DNA ligase
MAFQISTGSTVASTMMKSYAFDMLVSDGDDLRALPLHLRKNNLARLLTRRAWMVS